MSDLLNKASLVMVPSGYKEDTVYSVVPTDGAGDLTFTRASNGTRINSQGFVEVVPWNLLQYSEDFSNAIWPKSSLTFNSTVTAPNGTSTAQNYSTTAAYAYAIQTITVSSGEYYTASCYLKYTSGVGDISIGYADGPGVNYIRVTANLINGTIGSIDYGGNGANGTATITSVGDGWYRVTVSGTLIIGNAGLIVSNLFYGATTFSIWGAQLNIGSTAKPYFPTTDRLNVPRLTYQNGGGGCPSLLLEKQSTNILTYSDDFSNAVYTKRNSTIGSNVTTSPDGTTNADKIQEDTSNDRHDIYAGFTCTNGVTYTQTIFAKQGERRYCFMTFGTALLNPNDSFFDLQDGVVVSSPSGVTSSIENMGNGWYRCRITTTCVNDGTGYLVNGPAITGSNYIYQGVSGYGIYVYGAQIEASSYATSYIPTTSSSATRVADACYKTGISSLIGQTEGTLFVDFNYEAKPDVNGNIVMIIEGGSGEAFIYILGGTLLTQVYDGGAIQGNISGSIGAVGRKKIAFAYKQNDFVAYMNGAQIGTDTSGTIPTTTNLRLGEYYVTGYSLNSGINQAILFKTRLTNAELASLTTI